MHGVALLRCKDPRRGERSLVKALELRCHEAGPANTKRRLLTASLDSLTEQDIRYQICQCRLQTQNYSRALAVLQAIPVEQRSPKTLMAMAALWLRDRNKAEAIKCYEQVVSQNPAALDAIHSLIRLGVKATDLMTRIGPEIQALVVGTEMEWLTGWMELQASLHSYKTEKSVELCHRLISSQAREQPELQVALGQAYYLNGDYKKAITCFKTLYSKDSCLMKGMDMYAASLFVENDSKGLEELTNRMVSRCESGEESPEPWVVVATYTHLTCKKDSKALYFAQKACLASGNSISALLLKAKIMSESKGAAEAMNYFGEAYAIAPYRFDVVKALTEAYLAENKRNQAASVVSVAMKQFGQTARVLTLHASVLLSEAEKSGNRKSAKGYLERAVTRDRGHLPAVYALTKLYMEDKTFDKALEVLTRALEHENNNELHRRLADCYTHIGDHVRAMQHHNIAKKLEVGRERGSSEAAQSLNAGTNQQQQQSGGRAAAAPDPAAADVDIDDLAESDNEDMDEGDTDVVWSDQFDDE